MSIPDTPAEAATAKRLSIKGRPPFGGDNDLYRAPRAGSLLWSVSRFLAKAAGLVVVATLLLLALSRPLDLRRRFAAILPDSVEGFISSDSTASDQASLDAIRSKVAVKADVIQPEQGRSAGRVPSFGIGSTKEQVRAAQGSPSTESDTVWRYGASEVYFAGGRVVGWNAAPANPLRTR